MLHLIEISDRREKNLDVFWSVYMDKMKEFTILQQCCGRVAVMLLYICSDI